MTDGKKQEEPSFGFLTILDDPCGGMLGGLLLVNHRGRPIEFHCTAPIMPSRAEEILFGPTLRPHIHCERIGAVLVRKASTTPCVLLVNQLDTWPVADETSVPVVLVDPGPSTTHPTPGAPSIAEVPACLDRIDPALRGRIEQLLSELTRYVDLSEPFDRITEAIREAGLLTPPAASDIDTPDETTYERAA